MNEPDMFLITVVFGAENYEADMELPSTMPAERLCSKILDLLKNLYGGEFLKWDSCVLEYNSRILNDDETLLGTGIFDGSTIFVLDK